MITDPRRPLALSRQLLLACFIVGLLAATALAQPGEAAPPSTGPAAVLPASAAAHPPRADLARLDYRLQARALAPGVWVVEGENDDFSPANGCNIINTGFIATGEGVVVVNTGPSRRYGEQLRALIARTTAEPVVRVVQLNQHPDYFLGHQAFADVPRWATAATQAGVAAEAAAYENNLYRLCGDWMRGTETLPADRTLDPAAAQGRWRLGQREFEWLHLQGHTASDLVLIERRSGVAFVGGLVFARRVPTTPHARIGEWLDSLDRLAPALHGLTVVPSHGPVHADASGVEDTRAYLRWLDARFRRAAAEGQEMNELLRAPVPERFRHWAAFGSEYIRNVAHLYPRYEQGELAASRGPR